jgi:hypothetical protein
MVHQMRQCWRDDDRLISLKETIVGPDQPLADTVAMVMDTWLETSCIE